MQFKGADKQFEAFGLEQDLAGRGEGIVALVDGRPVDTYGDALVDAMALHLGPFTDRAFHVVFAARVEQFFEVGIVPRPPKLPPRELHWFAALMPARFLIRAEHD